MGTTVCVSGLVAAKVENFRGRQVGELMLRGRTEPIRAFEPVRADSDVASTADYDNAFKLLEAGDTGAIAAFATHVGKRPDDNLASFHLKRLLNGVAGIRIVLE